MAYLETLHLVPKELYNHLITKATTEQKKNITNLNVKQLNNFEGASEKVAIEYNDNQSNTSGQSIRQQPKKIKQYRKKPNNNPDSNDTRTPSNQKFNNASSRDSNTQTRFNGIDIGTQAHVEPFNIATQTTQEVHNQHTQTNQLGTSIETQTTKPEYSEAQTQIDIGPNRATTAVQTIPKTFRNASTQAKTFQDASTQGDQQFTQEVETQTIPKINKKMQTITDGVDIGNQTESGTEVSTQAGTNPIVSPKKTIKKGPRHEVKIPKFDDWLANKKKKKQRVTLSLENMKMTRYKPFQPVPSNESTDESRASTEQKPRQIKVINPVKQTQSKLKGNNRKPSMVVKNRPTKKVSVEKYKRSQDHNNGIDIKDPVEKPVPGLIVLPRGVKRKFKEEHDDERHKKQKTRHSIIGKKRYNIEEIRKTVSKKIIKRNGV